ncbi:MAG: RelA/SpoT family protein [Acidimicrobiia bacterium]|nr:RelA/SpoT family protein [Acidimicrobiia bacterium]
MYQSTPSSATTDPYGATIEDVIDEFLVHYPEGDAAFLRRAHETARLAHEGQKRKTGHPYIAHPVNVTHMLAEYGLDEETLAAALLHDTVEDTDLTLDDLTRDFSPQIARLIDGVTKLDRIRYSTPQKAQAATIRKMVVAMAQDVRVLIIKLFDRLHNIRTVSALRPEKQRRVARETLDIYAPLAHRLGIQEIKHELEDRCFAILHPGPTTEIEHKLAARSPEREAFIEKMITELGGILSDAGIDAEITGRPKHNYSIYRKMVDQDRTFEEIHDIIGIRVIVATVADCYAVLGLVHNHWTPVVGRLKDYIAVKKFNLYQSLHTTIIGPDGKPLEVQIRTPEMHHLAESGVAAHWRYKEGADAGVLDWVDLRALTEDTDDPEEFLDSLKLDLYTDEVFVLTPAGDVKSMARGATAVDFAYAIHTDVGHRCVGARINGRLLPLSTPLESGDTVEVITSKAQDAAPSRDWLKFVTTSRARSKIKAWFTRERRIQALSDGRSALSTLLKKEGYGSEERSSMLEAVVGEFGKGDLETLLMAVGEHELSAETVAQKAIRLTQPEPVIPDDELFTPTRSRDTAEGPLVVVEGMDDMLGRLAQCCSPIPGDDIVGYVTVGRGVSVHRSDCANLAYLEGEPERIVDVSWPKDRVGGYSTWLQVEAIDRTQLLRDVTQIVTETGGNISASSTVTGSDRFAILKYEIELADPSQLPRMIADIEEVDGVYSVFRIGEVRE